MKEIKILSVQVGLPKRSTELQKPNRTKNPGRRVSSRQLFAVPYGWESLTLLEMHRQTYRFTAAYTRRSMCIHPNITLTGGRISICQICLTAPLVKTSQHTACWKTKFALEICSGLEMLLCRFLSPDNLAGSWSGDGVSKILLSALKRQGGLAGISAS